MVRKKDMNKDYMEIVYGKEPLDIGGNLKNGIKRGEHCIYDPHHDEIVDMITGLVVSAHDNYKVSKDICRHPYEHYYDKTSDDVGYGDYVEEW